jgi:hypothetical protein
MAPVPGELDLVGQRGIDQAARLECRPQGGFDHPPHERGDGDGGVGIAVEAAQLAVGGEAGEALMPRQQRPLGHRRGHGGVGGARGVGHDHRALAAEAREGVAVLPGGTGAERKRPDAHDWLEVTELTPPEEPVELLVAPELVETVALDEVVSLLPEVVVVTGVAAWVSVLRASAGSWPVTSTTVMSSHAARNRATEPPMTRARILRTRARRGSLILVASSLVMDSRIGARHSNGV